MSERGHDFALALSDLLDDADGFSDEDILAGILEFVLCVQAVRPTIGERLRDGLDHFLAQPEIAQ